VRVIVDQDLCEGNGECVKAAPTVFVVGDDDRARVLLDRPAPADREAVQTAVRRCPRQALSIVDD
jgi:ferredoxin